MLNKFLKEVVSIVVGKQVEEIVDLLGTKKYENEFIIARKLDITINQTRNILYKISDYGLVSSIRKKDKKKGWYTYFWKIEVLKSLEFLKGDVLKRIEQINRQIENRERNRFYVCNRCNIELTEENAMLRDFTCNECGEIYEMKDNEKLIKELKKNLERFEKKLEDIDKEIEKEKGKLDKEKEKERKKEEKEKVQKREERKAERRKANKEKKKLPKKKVVKKKAVKKKTPSKKSVKKVKTPKKKKTIKKIKKKPKKKLPKKKVVKKKAVKKKTPSKKSVKKSVKKKR